MIVTNATPRAQNTYGRFQPRADTAKFGVMYAAVDGQSDGRFPHVGQVINDGVPFLEGKHAIKYQEYRDAKGKPHDVRLDNGQVVREMICPIQFVRQKDSMEARESEERVRLYTSRQKTPNRSVDGVVTRIDSIEEQFSQLETPHTEEDAAALTKANRRAAMAKARAAKAAKQSQPATTPTQ